MPLLSQPPSLTDYGADPIPGVLQRCTLGVHWGFLHAGTPPDAGATSEPQLALLCADTLGLVEENKRLRLEVQSLKERLLSTQQTNSPPPNLDFPIAMTPPELRGGVLWNLTIPSSRVFRDEVIIGSGTFGVVVRAFDGNRHVAIKRVSTVSDEERAMALSELDVLFRLRGAKHPNVIGLYEAYTSDTTLNLVLEYATFGSLEHLLQLVHVKKESLFEREIAYIMRAALDGLCAVHRCGVIHRDVKPGNILLGKCGEVKIADFGLAGQLTDKRTSMVGSPWYVAPEVCGRGADYGCKVDVFAIGIVCIECADGAPQPVEEKPSLAARWSDVFCDFVEKCTVVDPKKRPSAEVMLQHRFLNQTATKEEMTDLLSWASTSAPATPPGFGPVPVHANGTVPA